MCFHHIFFMFSVCISLLLATYSDMLVNLVSVPAPLSELELWFSRLIETGGGDCPGTEQEGGRERSTADQMNDTQSGLCMHFNYSANTLNFFILHIM